MSDRNQYFVVDQAHDLAQAFPGSSSTDTVTITIFDIDNATTDVNTAMTYVNNETWKYLNWTPDNNGLYLISFYNSTIDVKYYLYAQVVGNLTFVPGGSGVGSTLANLRTRFLKMIDNYNANDLTGTNSSGEVADLYLNNGLQNIYAIIKASRHLDAYADTSLISVASQSYINLSTITDLDEIVSIKDTSNEITLQCITPAQYFMSTPNPAGRTGVPTQYCRIFNRIYLNAQPTSAITYTTQYKKTYARLTNDSDQALIPSKFDTWIYDEAWVMWLRGEDPGASGAIQLAQAERERTQGIYINDIGSEFDMVPQSASHWEDTSSSQGYPYTRPVG